MKRESKSSQVFSLCLVWPPTCGGLSLVRTCEAGARASTSTSASTRIRKRKFSLFLVLGLLLASRFHACEQGVLRLLLRLRLLHTCEPDFMVACASLRLIWTSQISSQVSFNLRRLASCVNTKNKSMRVFGIKIKHGSLAWSRCCFESKQHSRRNGKKKEMVKFGNTEVNSGSKNVSLRQLFNGLS